MYIGTCFLWYVLTQIDESTFKVPGKQIGRSDDRNTSTAKHGYFGALIGELNAIGFAG